MNALPFRLRIALVSSLLSGGVLLAFGGGAWHLLQRERVAALDREIRALAYRHPGWMGGRANYERLSSAIEFAFGGEHPHALLLLVKDASGQTRYRSEHWPPDLDPEQFDLRLDDDPAAAHRPGGPGESTESESTNAASRGLGRGQGGSGLGLGSGRGRAASLRPGVFSKLPRFFTVRTASATWRLGILGNAEDRLILGLDYAGLQAELDRMRAVFWWTLPLPLVLVGLGGWMVGGWAMRPLRRISDAAERVTARGLDQRIPESVEDREITRLIRVLNGMMDRLESSFRQATRFSADASHELKTPLAVMQGTIETALQSADLGSEQQQVFAALLEATERLKTITRGLLWLARADAGQLVAQPVPVDLSALLGGVIEDVETLAAESGLRLEHAVAPGIRVRGDRALLQQALLNLLHNAVKYNAPQGRVLLRLALESHGAQLEVTNTGPGIPPEDQARIFDRFFRGTASTRERVEGAGLGLSLAREIARAHGGELQLVESRPGRTAFRMTLPAGTEQPANAHGSSTAR